jgi:hypothetical protein
LKAVIGLKKGNAIAGLPDVLRGNHQQIWKPFARKNKLVKISGFWF